MLLDWHQSWVEAYQEGVAGTLEPNAVFEPHHDLLQAVPDVTVRGYFIANDPDRTYEPTLLVRRLQRMDVEVRQLTAPLDARRLPSVRRGRRASTLPAGTYWITLAQAQKHWIQAMLNEETWIPFDVTYDVTAWSNPLLMNLDGGWSGDVGRRRPRPVVPRSPAPTWDLTPGDPSVGLFEIPTAAPAASSRPARRLPVPRRLGPRVRTT